MIQFKCPHCQTLMEADDSAALQKAKCPHCDQLVDVPLPTYLPYMTCPNPKCQTELNLTAEHAGTIYKCPKCSTSFMVPELSGQTRSGGCFVSSLVAVLIAAGLAWLVTG